jgi:predicted lactoylglutathione lyase
VNEVAANPESGVDEVTTNLESGAEEINDNLEQQSTYKRTLNEPDDNYYNYHNTD